MLESNAFISCTYVCTCSKVNKPKTCTFSPTVFLTTRVTRHAFFYGSTMWTKVTSRVCRFERSASIRRVCPKLTYILTLAVCECVEVLGSGTFCLKFLKCQSAGDSMRKAVSASLSQYTTASFLLTFSLEKGARFLKSIIVHV